VEQLLATWSEDEFIERIPHLRMAFAGLTPRETDQVASVVAELHGGENIGSLHHPGDGEAEMLAAIGINARVAKALEEDGLGAWIAPHESAVHPPEVPS
jgi:hypothetical protein